MKPAIVKEKKAPLLSLGNDDVELIQKFLTDYYDAISWQLTHTQNIERILKPRLEIFFKQLGCTVTSDVQRRINDLVFKYTEVLTIWRTHHQNVFLGLEPLLKDAVLNIRNTCDTEGGK